MVEYTASLDIVFASLSHPTRRDILSRLQKGELTVSEIAEPYAVSLAAISKHLSLLQKAHLIVKRVKGTTHYVAIEPKTMQGTIDYMRQYEKSWQDRFDRLDKLMQEN